MNRKKIGTITLAIAFISIGSLLLARNFTDLDTRLLLSILWPSIIIIFGVELIITKTLYAKEESKDNIKVDGLSLTLLVLIVAISSFISSVDVNFGFNIFSGLRSGINIGTNFNIHYKYQDDYEYEYKFNSDDKNKLEVLNRFGNVDIIKEEVQDIEVKAKIRISHNNKEYADEFSKSAVIITEAGNKLEIKSKSLGNSSERNEVGNLSISYVIKVPKDIDVDIDNSFGDVYIDNTGNLAKINNKHGSVTVKSINGDLTVENSFGSTKVSSISGSVRIDSKHGGVNAKDIKQSLIVNNSFGEVTVENIGGNTEITNSHNTIEAKKVKGNLKIDSQFSRVYAADIEGNLDAKGNNGNMALSDIQGNLDVSNRFGNINVKKANKIVRIMSRNGTVEFETTKAVEQELDIQNEFGNISISIPSNQGGNFDINTSFGKLNSNFDFNINKEVNQESVREKIGTDNAKFYIRTRNGNINIKKN